MSILSPGLGYPVARARIRYDVVLRVIRGGVDMLLRIAFFTAAGFAVGICATTTIPRLFGYVALDELSGSMSPAIRVGDEVIVKRMAPLDARIGDIVTFRSPDDGRLLTHRVVDLRLHGSMVDFVTRGDANTGSERWAIPRGGTIGKVVARIPKLGYIANRTGSRVGRVALIVFPVLLLGFLELWRIWRPREDGGDAAA